MNTIMDDGRADFHDDWEILGHGSDSPRLISVETLDGNDEGMGDGASGIIKVDYFTVQGSGFYHGGDVSESGGEKPSWVDPGSDIVRYGKSSAAELWSDDSGSDESVKRNGGLVLGAGVEVKGEISLHESVQNDIREFEDEVVEQNDLDEVDVGDDGIGIKLAEERENKEVTEEESRSGVVWWKVPFELMRYSVMRMGNPVWTFSVAAAIMVAVMLRRKFYRMKQKRHALHLKVSVDDKEVVSQIMSSAGTFSLVRRVPILRPVLPAPGVSPWPAISMR